MEELQKLLDQIIYDGYRLRDIALGIVLAGIFIILLRKLIWAMKASKTEEYSIRIKCPKCGWEGKVGKYARICPRCGRKV
ncbi:MAG: hypothetical protein HZC10_03005 [Nitrospirae bacterium]|nr:hypothetical protein [Nitrospirota bacterium]